MEPFYTAYLVAFLTPTKAGEAKVTFSTTSDRNPTTMGNGTVTFVVDQEQGQSFQEAHKALKNRLDSDPRFRGIGSRDSGDYRLSNPDEYAYLLMDQAYKNSRKTQ